MIKLKNTQSGFTLIELLVVIAIIGILSGIVITALSGAREKAVESEIKSNLAGFRTAAELSYIDNNNSYNLVCTGGNEYTSSYFLALPAVGYACYAEKDNYAISARINDTPQNWCVDSKGYTGLGAANGGTFSCN